jgi:hypothetical protein
MGDMAANAESSEVRARNRRRRPRSARKRVDALEARVRALEDRIMKLEAPDDARSPESASCCEDLIGCLDDCVTDVQELRRKVKDARS